MEPTRQQYNEVRTKFALLQVEFRKLEARCKKAERNFDLLHGLLWVVALAVVTWRLAQ
jgi:hypothetical protein